MENSEASSHLIVVIDLLPQFVPSDPNFYDIWLNAIITFCNSHLLLNANNRLTVIASNFDQNTIIYPSEKMENGETFTAIPGQYELFSVVAKVISAQLKSLISNARRYLESRPDRLTNLQSLIAGAIGIGLAKINKMKSSMQNSRIAIVTAADDNSASFSSQYMNFMNVFFTAQKMGVVLDACVTCPSNSPDNGMSLLQQGCDLTNGLYLRIPNHTALLEYLEWVLLPDVETRKKLLLPTQKKISHKAACFCHRTLIDTGYVCSVCLSIFCSFSPICSTCHTVFKLGPLPSGIKLKRKPAKFK